MLISQAPVSKVGQVKGVLENLLVPLDKRRDLKESATTFLRVHSLFIVYGHPHIRFYMTTQAKKAKLRKLCKGADCKVICIKSNRLS